MRFTNKVVCIIFIGLSPLFVVAQSKEKPKDNWQNLDLKTDGVFGISTEKAYNLLKGKVAMPIIVAVIDGGIFEVHEDLKTSMWINEKEIPGNGVDDDKNGYADDINGWNFIGSPNKNVQYDNMELTRLVKKLQPKYSAALNSTPFNEEERKEFVQYQKLIAAYMDELQKAQMGYENTMLFKRYLEEITAKMKINNPVLADFDKYKPANDIESRVLKALKSELKDGTTLNEIQEDLTEGFKYYSTLLKYHLNLDYNSRDSVGDNYSDSNERIYGNPDITGPDAEHGTHVAGIIAASRINNLGIKGVADNVKIMGIRAVPDGDERDKDVANAIRYAVDNNAKIINMSFGKSYSWDKKVVDEAVKYAMSKNVLLIHAAGNDGLNTDKENNFPNRLFVDSIGVNMGKAPLWIEVGASGWKNDEDLVADFSNFGKKTVDVFAPGVKINSTMPDSKYKENDGTSMASPVVAGLAALIWSYYPYLSALQVKEAIMNSVSKVEQKVKIKENGSSKKVSFDEISVSGGIVNAYNAILLAEKMSKSQSSNSQSEVN
ncbi:S8 family peptidase [Daejeonella oryzae]|uniref:S8 family peptidase n=1 Tax=Daejeonella oryzae TaxID=1122943 RepID=UPI0004034CE3|nr:S8 family peptidase [Daejeonella oryzae]